jgi:hypothetical protein
MATLIGTLTGNTSATALHTAATTANVTATGTAAGSTLANTLSTDANTIATNFQAAVASVAALFGFAEGTPMVQQTGLALIHQGEMIVPAHLNPNNVGNSLGIAAANSNTPGGSSGSSGGDTHVHLHMSAIDSGGVRDFFHDNSEHLASALHSAITSGNHGGLAALGR